MIEILASNYPPLKTGHSTFEGKFSYLIDKAEKLDIAVGYVSEKSLEQLTDHIHRKGKPFCNLVIGMHYFEHFTRNQYAAAVHTEEFLRGNGLGAVKLLTSFPYHGKLYSFRYRNGKPVSILGSSNLNNILPHKPVRQYEFDLFVDDEETNLELAKFVDSLIAISPDLSSPDLNISEFRDANRLMEDLGGVNKVENTRVSAVKRDLVKEKSIEIPIKTAEQAPKSNVNVYFGEGRKSASTGTVKKRPWYEVELIVPRTITDLPWYPKAGPSGESIIAAVTDDGYGFPCKISGDYSKNFRSAGDLKILGKWLKGRLEATGVLKIGQPITRQTLERYGRSSISMTPTKGDNTWFLDFGV